MSITVSFVAWAEAAPDLAHIRRRVFIEEQSVPESLEWDGLDETAKHVLARNQKGQAIGCARLLSNGRIGRMAVLQEWRGRGVARTMLETMLADLRRQNVPAASLSAQTHAIPFYEKYGFRVCSAIYDDAGMPHQDMRLSLSS